MNEEDYKLLDQFLQRELPAEEQQAFEQRLRTDEEFAAALAARQEMHTYLRTEAQRPALEAELERLGKAHFSAGNEEAKIISPRWRRWTAVGVAAAILLLLAIWNPFSGSLYDQYAQHPPLALVEKGGALALAQEAEVAYRARDFEQAYDLLNTLTDLSSGNPQLQLALGISALEIGRVTKARQLFEALANGNSSLKNYGQWYLALSYLKEGEEAQAKEALEKLDQSDQELRSKADELREKL